MKRMKIKFTWWISSKRFDQSHVTMHLLAKVFVSNAFAKLFADDMLSFFTNVLPEQVSLEGQWKVAFSEITYPSLYQKDAEGFFLSFGKTTVKSSKSIFLEPGACLACTETVETMNTFFEEQQKRGESFITFRVCWRTPKWGVSCKWRIWFSIFRMKLGYILEIMLEMNLRYCWEEKDLTN